LKGHSQLWNRADLDNSFLTLKKFHLDLKAKYIEICFNLGSVLLDFQPFTEKLVFECAFAHPDVIFIIWLKTVWIASL